MKAEVTGGADGELIITLTTSDIPGGDRISSQSLARTLPGSAGPLIDGILAMIGQPPQPGQPKTVRAATVRIVRCEIVGETTVMLDADREVYT